MIKAYTDIEQSKKLTRILPLESADLYYDIGFDKDYHIKMPTNGYFGNKRFFIQFPETVPCWSLAVLLHILPQTVRLVGTSKDSYWYCECVSANNQEYAGFGSVDNPIDACYEMILKLHERKML